MGEVSVGMNLRIPYLDWNLVWVYSLAVWYVFCNSNFCTSFTRWCFWISRCFPKIYASNSKRVMLWCCKNMQKLEHGLKHEQNPQSGILGFFLVVFFLWILPLCKSPWKTTIWKKTFGSVFPSIEESQIQENQHVFWKLMVGSDDSFPFFKWSRDISLKWCLS